MIRPSRHGAVTLGSAALLPLLLACNRPSASQAAPIRVAAASDLARAFEEIAALHERTTGQKVQLTFGSTGLLTSQIRQGAPFDLFAAASASYIEQVVAAGVCDGATRAPYGQGRIAVWSKRSASPAPSRLSDLLDPRFARIAIAHPDHAPYGQAARAALQKAGLWEQLQGRLVYGENIRQAHQFAVTGNAEVALVALSLVAGDRDNPWFLLEGGLHPPLRQELVVCGGGGNAAGGQSFARTVAGAEGRAILERAGFEGVPEAKPEGR
jgi:molybdate transport system substrate-binding protein